MIKGTRETWARLLPLINAFVAGTKIQRKQYDGKWSDSDTLHSILHGDNWRIKPDNLQQGVWSRKYTHSENGVLFTGVAEVAGTNLDTPVWPNLAGRITYIEDPIFTTLKT